MATAQKAAKNKKPGTAVVAWEQQMAEAAKAQSAVEKVSGAHKAISLRSGILSVDDNPVPNNELRCVVIASAFENQFFEGKFNASDVRPPVCFALSLDGEGMAPHENSTDVQCEGSACDGCWANEMGSADTGRGKACKNIRRLLLVTEDSLESAEALADAEPRSLKVPVTSVNNWAKHVNRVADEMARPSWGVITLIKVVPDAKTQFKVQFSFEELINFDQPLFDAMQAKIAELNKDITMPYAVPGDEPEAQQSQRRKPAGKPDKPAGKKPAAAPARRGGKF